MAAFCGSNCERSKQKAECVFVTHSAFVFPGTGAAEAAPVRRRKSHREALAVAVDPETASVSKYIAPTQEGGLHRLPAKSTRTTGLQLYGM